MEKSNDKIILDGIFEKFSQKNNGRIYDKEVFKDKVIDISLSMNVKPHIETAIKDGYIDKVLNMIDDNLIEIYLREKKIKKKLKK